MITPKNKFPTYCVSCSADVVAGHGRPMRLAGKWVCHCRPLPTENDLAGSDDGYDAMRDRRREAGY